MKPRVWIAGCLVAAWCAIAPATVVAANAQPPAPAGRIKVMTGTVVVVRAGVAVPARLGQIVFEADTLKTGPDGRVGFTLLDDTRVSLGPDSDVRLDRFAYAPADGRFALVMNFVHGVAAYVSGRIAKLAPDAVRLETPSAIVGVRGTTIVISVP
jgi:hypothetical protein